MPLNNPGRPSYYDLVNETTITFGTITTKTIGIVVSLVNGIYTWFYSAVDIYNNKGYSDNGNFTLNVSVPPVLPNVTLISPANNTIFGLNKSILIFSTALIVGSLSYLAYKKIKNK